MKRVVEEDYCDRCGALEECRVIGQRSASGNTQNDPASGKTEHETDLIDLCFECAITLLAKLNTKDGGISTGGFAHQPRTEFH